MKNIFGSSFDIFNGGLHTVIMASHASKKISISLAGALCDRANAEAARRNIPLSRLIAWSLESYLSETPVQIESRLAHIEARLDSLAANLECGRLTKREELSRCLKGAHQGSEKKNLRAYKGADDVGFMVRAIVRKGKESPLSEKKHALKKAR